MASTHALKMADISKGKRSTGRRSSILKRALADIDVNVKEKKETTSRRRPSKRVSFAETYVVKEFPRDSPQTLKDKQNGAEHEDSGGCELVTPQQEVQVAVEAEQSWVDGNASAVSFAIEEGETTFISGMAVADGFPRESTRIVDQDLVLRPPVQQMGNWEPAATEVLGMSMGENSVLVPTQLPPRKGLAVAASTCFPASANRTVIFDTQDDGNMELTLVNTSGAEGNVSVADVPKISARDFLSKLTGSSGQVAGMTQVREEHTILFTNMDQGNTMELTGVHDLQQQCTITTATAAACSGGPLQEMKSALSIGDRTVIFGTAGTACDMNLTQNLSLAEDVVSVRNMSMMQNQSLMEEAKAVNPQPASLMSAKSFLASLKAATPAVVQPPAVTTIASQPEEVDMTMTMELTGCQDVLKPPVLDASLSRSVTMSGPFVSQAQFISQSTFTATQSSHTVTGQTLQKENIVPTGLTKQQDVSATVIRTTLAQIGPGPQIATAPLTVHANTEVPVFQGAPVPLAQPVQYGGKQNNSDIGETTELSGFVENTRQLLQDAGSSFLACTTQSAPVTLTQGAPSSDIAGPSLMPKTSRSSFSTVSSSERKADTVSKKELETLPQQASSLDSSKLSAFPQEPKLGATRSAFTSISKSQGVGQSFHQTPTMPQADTSNKNDRFCSEDTCVAMEMTEMLSDHPASAKPQSAPEERTVRFSPEDTCAAMEITEVADAVLGQLKSSVVSQSEPEERTVRFSSEDTCAAMEMTEISGTPDGQPQSSATTQSGLGEKTVRFDDDTCAAMELTIISDNTVGRQSSTSGNTTGVSSEQTNTSGVITFKQQATSAQSPVLEKTTVFNSEETKAEMSFTCNVAGFPVEQAVDGVPSEQTNTSGIVTFKQQASSAQSPVLEKTTVFNSEETKADMSITCNVAGFPVEQAVDGVPSGQTNTSGIVTFKQQASSAQSPVLEKTTVFNSEETKADMSITCNVAGFPAEQAVGHQDSANKSNTQDKAEHQNCSATEETATSMNIKSVSVTKANQADGEKTAVFSADQKESEMELTCAAGINSDPDIDEKMESRVLTNEKTRLFSAEETGAQMTMTCPLPAGSDEGDGGDEPGERTALMELTGVLAQLRVQLGMNSSGTATTTASGPASSIQTSDQLTSAGTSLSAHSMGQAADADKERKENGNPQAETGAESRPLTSLSQSHSQPRLINSTTMSQRPLRLSTGTRNSSILGHPFSSDSNKRRLQSLNMLIQGPRAKSLKLSSQSSAASDTGLSIDSHQASTACDTSSATTAKPDQNHREEMSSDASASPEALNQTGSSGNSIMSPTDIFGETMPALPNTSGMPGESSCNPLSVSVNPNLTSSSISLGRSFAERKGDSDHPPTSVEEFLTSMDIELFELKGRRRSSGIFKPDLDCETPEDQLNVATVVKCECEVKRQALQTLAGLVEQKAAATADLEVTAMGQVAKVIGAANKTDNEEKHQTMCDEMGEMTSCTETMATMAENLKLSIDKAREQLQRLRTTASKGKKDARHHSLQQKMQQKQTELGSIRERITEAKSAHCLLEQQLSDFQLKERRANERHRVARETRQQLAKAHDKLRILHSLHSWRPVRVEDSKLELLLLCDSVLLTIKLQGLPSPQQQLHSLTVTSRLKEGSQPWAVLATRLVVDGLSAVSDRLLATFPSRNQLPQ
ncbi:hypothetical protein BaRGS_00004586, partial [Batillaria attramentaria]